MSGQRLTNVIKLYSATAGTSPVGTGTPVGNVVDFNGPQTTNDRIEVTDGDSPASSKEYLPSRQDPGPVQTTLNMVPSVHAALFTAANAVPPTVKEYLLQFSSVTGDFFQGPAFVASLAPSGNSRGATLQLAASFQPTEVWALTAA